MRADIIAELGLDPDVINLNHGAFGCVPIAVRQAVARTQERCERNPNRFFMDEVRELIASARVRAAGFLGLDPDECALVRNVSEGVSAVLGSLELAAGDEVVVNNHGYAAVRLAVEHWVARRGVVLVTADFALGAADEEIVAAYAAVCGPRTRLAVVDQITSPTATVLPVSAIAAGVGPPVLVDAAHVPGTLRTDIVALGAAYWIGNLHKWGFVPRGSAVLWSCDAVRDATYPSVLSWQVADGYSRSFDFPGTDDYTGWISIPTGLDFWASLGGWDSVAQQSALGAKGQQLVADAVDTPVAGLPPTPAPTMRLVRLPERLAAGPEQTAAVSNRLSSEHAIETVPVWFAGRPFLRIAAAAYNTIGDYEALGRALVAAC
ncbi:MAG: aminotransferase class V-fold PLP-dependent enzyme [Mycobacteriales bacterium]